MFLAVAVIVAAPSSRAADRRGRSNADSLEVRINRIANDVANRRPYFDDDPLPVHIATSFNDDGDLLIMDLGERLGPRSGLATVEELEADIQESIWPLVNGRPGFKGIEWRFGGKDMYHWFPQDRPKPLSMKRFGGPDVLIGAGHGYYYHYGFKDWRPQRDVHHGILEDEITTEYASVLFGTLLISGVSPASIRESSFGNHGPSGQPYHMIAARYQLQDKLPARPDIWHSLPDNTEDQRERLEDIRSRPLYANEVGAGALIHLHTNALDNPAVRGTRVFYQLGSSESARLGSMILCYMGEAIHSIEKYRDFPVDSAPTPGNHGENRLASMPSVIVEVGFHTNAEDAAALTDYKFMTHSMTGVAKGYRLFDSGRTCEPFEISAPAAVEAKVDQDAVVMASGAGFPTFPVAFRLTLAACDPSSGSCGIDYESIRSEEQLGSVGLSFTCRAEHVGKTVKLELTAEDFEGVKAGPIAISAMCHPKDEAASLIE